MAQSHILKVIMICLQSNVLTSNVNTINRLRNTGEVLSLLVLGVVGVC